MINNYISDTGLRRDGRKPNETRNIECKLGIISNSDGSASFKIGNSLVYASIDGPKHSQTRQGKQSYDSGTLICNVETNEFSIGEHHSSHRFRKRDKLLSELIRETFSCLILLELYPRSTININIEILQNDGGIDIASINCVCLALIDGGIAMKEYCVACNAGYLGGSNIACIDLNYFEHNGTKAIDKSDKSNNKIKDLDKGTHQRLNKKRQFHLKSKSRLKENEIENEDKQDIDIEIDKGNNRNDDDGEPDGSISCGIVTMAIMPKCDKIVTMQMQSMINVQKFDKLMQACNKGCQIIYHSMQQAVKRHSFKLLQHRGFI